MRSGAQGSIDLWVADLTAPHWADPEILAQTLSTGERDRAAGFFDREVAREYLAGCLVTRLVLGARTGDPRIAIAPDGREKPQAAAGSGLQVNRTHSGPVLAVVVAGAEATQGIMALGVDVEVLRPIPAANAFARRISSAAEARRSENPPPEGAVAIWTAKEAALKATGLGLHGDPRDWTFSWADIGRPRLLEAPAQAGPVDRWAFATVRLDWPAEAIATVAVRFERPKTMRLQLRLIRQAGDITGPKRKAYAAAATCR